MKKTACVFLVASSLAFAAEGASSRWGLQVGAIRADGIHPSLDGQTGMDLEAFWNRPFSPRQDLQVKAGLTALKGKTVPAYFVQATAWPLTILGQGQIKSELNSAFVGVDYRFRWFHGETTPYVSAGLLGGLLERTDSFALAGVSGQHTDRNFKTGLDFGIGMLFGKHLGVELRRQGYHAADDSEAFVLAATWRF